jgi:hypothetical protein
MRGIHESKLIEVCNHCGDPVVLGSGKFVNRIPDFNDKKTRILNKRRYPNGDFVCDKCDNDPFS